MAENPGDKAARVALDQVGKPYVWGKQGPASFDCSGLVHYCYEVGAGLWVPQGSIDYGSFGTTVQASAGDISNLRPGDVLGYDWLETGRVSHVGIYIGNNQLIEAFDEKRGVIMAAPFEGGRPDVFMRACRPFTYNQVTGTDAIVQAIIQAIQAALNIPQTNTHRVTSNTNVRQGAGTNYGILTTLQTGTLVNVNPKVQPKQAGGFTWVQIETATGVEGWMVNSSLVPA